MTHGVAVLSLPALGAVSVPRRATDAIRVGSDEAAREAAYGYQPDERFSR
jgi:hypothetical protein